MKTLDEAAREFIALFERMAILVYQRSARIIDLDSTT
jgi:hypothetical protein